MLYLMRHGKTEWNALHKLQGRTDVPLCGEGRAMALKAGEEYRGVHFDVCYSSPLIRARETAELMLKGRDVPILIDERLAEMAFGEYEGMEYGVLGPPSPISVIFTHPEKYVEPIGGAETFPELFQRTGSFLKEVIEPQMKKGKDVLIVGHGAMNASLVCQIKNIPIERFWDCGLEQCRLMALCRNTSGA